MSEPPTSVTVAAAQPLEPFAAVLAAGFAEDPFYSWMLPDAATRPEALRTYFLAKLEAAAAAEGSTILASPAGSTVLLVHRYDHTETTGSAPEPSPALAAVAGHLGDDHRRHVEAVLAAIPTHPEPHDVVDVIATDPPARGRGEGSTLMRGWLATRRGIVRLESSSPRNLPFYERLGFTAEPAIALPHGAGSVTPMHLG